MPVHQRFKIQLGDANAYVYRSYPKDRKKRRWWSMCTSSHTPEESHVAPPHALALYADASEVDKTWSILLLSEQEHEMRNQHKSSIYIYDQITKSLMFKSKVAAPKQDSIEMDAVRDAAVRDVLRLSIVNGHHTESIVTLSDAKRIVVVSIPVWSDRDVLCGSLWTAKTVDVQEQDRLVPIAAQKKAALYYDVDSCTFVLNESWMRQRDLLSGSFTGGQNENAVFLLDSHGMVDMTKNLDKAGQLAMPIREYVYPCPLANILTDKVAKQLMEGIGYLAENQHQGRVLTGFTMNEHGYSAVITKIMNNSQNLNGFVITISEEDSLADIVKALRPEHKPA